MKKELQTNIQYATAVAMLFAGAGLSIAGFIVPPTGEISDSVLWFFAQCLIYAGSIFGIGIYVKGRFDAFARQLSVNGESVPPMSHQGGARPTPGDTGADSSDGSPSTAGAIDGEQAFD